MVLIRSLVSLACLTLAAPAFAETVAYECKVGSTIIDGKVTTYTDAMRANPQFAKRFAVDVAAGKACLMMGDICDPFFNVLKAEEKPNMISATGTRISDGGYVSFQFFPDRGQAVFRAGGVSTNTRPKDCAVITSTVKLP